MNGNDHNHHDIFLSIGSNIEPQENLPKAFALLCQVVHIDRVSRVWKTSAVGGAGPDFLNAALHVRTQLAPEMLKSQVLRPIEAQLGRVRSDNKFAPRTIDLDILIVDGMVCDPQIWMQAFLAVPLAELLPDFDHIENGETLSEAAARLSANQPIEVYLQLHLECAE